MPVTQTSLDATYALILAAAIAGTRCPQGQPHGPLHKESTTSLAKAGRIKIEIFFHNWRVVTIMEGENRGKTTQACPKPGAKAYALVYKDHFLPRRAAR